MSKKTTLCQYGYLLPWNQDNLDKIRDDLTIIPKSINPKFPNKKPIHCWKSDSSGKWLIIPRLYGEWKFGKAQGNILEDGENFSFQDVKISPHNLGKDQTKAYRTIIKTLQESGGCLGVFPTGFGKSRMAIWIALALGKKTIILAPRNQILKNWSSEILLIRPHASVSFDKKDIGNVDFSLITYNSWVMIGEVETLAKIGFLIVDEIHLINSRIFSAAVSSWVFRYSLGLTATLSRLDGAEKISHFYIGRKIIKMDKISKNHQQPKTLIVLKLRTQIKPIAQNSSGILDWSKLILELTHNEARNQAITQILENILEEGRNILVLTGTRDHADILSEKMKHLGALPLHGGLTSKIQEINKEKAKILIATYSLCSTGFNLPRLDTLLMATPRKTYSMEQITGRILRKVHNKPALYIDIDDSLFYTKKQFGERLEWFRALPNIKIFTRKIYKDEL